MAILGQILQGDIALVWGIASLFVLTGSASYACHFQFQQPAVWFSIGFFLYSISAPLLYLLGTYRFYPGYQYALMLEFLALAAFLAGCRFRVFTWEHYGLLRTQLNSYLAGSQLLSIISGFLSIGFLFYVANSGVVSKFDKVLVNDPILKMDFIFTILIVYISVLVIYKLIQKNKLPWTLVSLMGLYLLASLAIIGERDFFIRFILIVFVLYVGFLGNPKFSKTILWGSVLVFISTILGLFKNVLLSHQVGDIGAFQYIEGGSGLAAFLTLMFGAEFRSASENLAVLVEDIRHQGNYLYGTGFLGELSSVLGLGFLEEVGDGPKTLSEKFASTYYTSYYELGGGLGFTLVGQGFVDWGIFGVIVLFYALGHLVRFIYNRTRKSMVYLVIYVNSIPILLMSIRQTVAVIVAQPLKHVLIPLVFAYIATEILRYFKHQRTATNLERQEP